MDFKAIVDAAADIIREVPRSGLLMATVAAIVGSFVGSAIARRGSAAGRTLAGASTLVLAGILVVVVLQVSRFDPRLDVAVPELGLPPQTVAGGETRVPMAPDGHFWIRAEVNGFAAPFLVDTGATLTAVSVPVADHAGLRPRAGGLPVRISTANGTVSAELTTIDTLRFGNIKAGGLDAVIAPNIGETNVIGMNLLSRLASWRVEDNVLILRPHNPQPVAVD
ncbi:TIGR02281 family clan AA aspartic protease [Tsuneonella sp. YG55]|uniref:TIGR02281 family clan AA aspartic protease n=1 Tax=Tsuneonella litorea TaxID=2976475 RepID=A0A9X2W154_9SPHN|nr:TIGR02281 family clan AA aspartic protease [Tsuneonella litorea]MCT2558294.1 TIGR02281 family clan AA aspartic protease [Tsuneonella litorea]